MKYQILFLVLLLINLNSCGKDDEEKANTLNKNKDSVNGTSLDTNTTSATEINASENNAINQIKNKFSAKSRNKNARISTSDTINNREEIKPNETNSNNSTSANDSYYLPLRRFLEISKIGVPITKKELAEQYNIPKEGLKLIKSITKTAEDKLFIKWNSNWLIEKFSDARLKDDTVKIHFHEDKLYISGNAIGIKYNKKIYTDLILKGNLAYIPDVKGFHWQIGK